MAMAIGRSPGPPVRSTSDASFSPLYSFAVPGAAGNNRGEAAERQPLARTQGRNLDRVLNFKPTPCVGCLLTPQGQTYAPRTGLPTRQILLKQALRRRRGDDSSTVNGPRGMAALAH